MILGIAVICAVRDKYTLACIFALNCATMFCGLATEIYSRPALVVEGGKVTDKYNMEMWAGDPVRVGDSTKDEQFALKFGDGARWGNYLYRMVPHFFGIFPYSFAWFPIIDSFFQQVDDLCDRLEELMPSWVPLVIVGCFAIFSCFTFVQWRCVAAAPASGGDPRADALPRRRYQWTAPKHYWRTEVWYCVLSVRTLAARNSEIVY